MDLSGFLNELKNTDIYKYMGKIEKIVGMTIEASGPVSVSYTHLTLPTI